MMSKNKTLKIFASVSGLMILDKILGFVKQMFVASTFGATIETDIINLSQGAVSDIQYILAQALITSFVSIYIYSQQGENNSAEKSRIFVGDAIKAFAVISFALTAVLYFSSDILAKILAPSYSIELISQLSNYIKLYSTIIVLFSIICIFRAVLSANKNFIPEQLVSFNQSAITIITVVILGHMWGPKVLVVSFFVFTVWNAVFLGFLCRKEIVLRFSNPLKNPHVPKLFKMILPLLLGYSLIYVNQMVDRMLVSGLGAGVITALTYGSVLSNLVTAFVSTFCNIIFSYITTEISTGRYKVASDIANTSAKTFTIAFMPITLIFVICSHDIVSIVYGRGAFDASAVMSASYALKGYAIMFLPMVFREIYTRFQYAFQDSKKPMINGSIGIVSNIVLSIIFCQFWGVFGVALATSISVLISAVLNLLTARGKTSELNYSFMKGFSFKLVGVTLIAIIASISIYNQLEMHSFFKLIIISAICFGVFGICFLKDLFKGLKGLCNLKK